MLGRRLQRFLRQHRGQTIRQQRVYESYKKNFETPVSPHLQSEDFFKDYEDVIDVDSSLPVRGLLTVCPTPLGNLGDMTFRSYRALKSADIIACEDTRVTGMLLQLLPRYKGGKVHDLRINDFPEVDEYSYGLADDFVSHTVKKVAELRATKGRGLMISFNSHNQANRSMKLVKLMQSGLNVALTSDAGTPLLSDPGAVLVAETVRAGVRVEALPGPVAAVVAVTASGMQCDQFFFQGYLSKTDSERIQRLQKMQEAGVTSVIYESCHRIVKTLTLIEEVFGPQHPVYVGQELTKRYERNHYGSAAQVAQTFRHMDKIYGELTVVVAPSGFKQPPKQDIEVPISIRDLTAVLEATSPRNPRERQELVARLTGATRSHVTRIVRDIKHEVKQAANPQKQEDDLPI